jgi:hypothetical protein
MDSTVVGLSTVANYDSNQPTSTLGSSNNSSITRASDSISSKFRDRVVFDIRYDSNDGSYGSFLIINNGRDDGTAINQVMLLSFSKGYLANISGSLNTLQTIPPTPIPTITNGNAPTLSQRIILNIRSSHGGGRQTINVIQIGGIRLTGSNQNIFDINFARSSDQTSSWDITFTPLPPP